MSAKIRVAERPLEPSVLEAPRIDVSGPFAVARVFIREIGAPFAVTRLLLIVAAVVSTAVLPTSPFVPGYWQRPGIAPALDAFSRWDGWHYLNLAQTGYLANGADEAAFFPLYPVLMRSGGLLSGSLSIGTLEFWGLLISNACLLIAGGLLFALVRMDAGRDLASRSVWYLLIFPTSFFLSALYADALFLALSLGAIYAARRERWLVAGLLGAGAALTRPFGVAIAVPLAVELVLQWRERGPRWRALPAIGAIPAALGAYMLFLQRMYGDPFTFVHVQSGWERHLMAPWDTFAHFFSQPLTVASGEHALVDLGFAVLALVAVILAWRMLRTSYAAYLTVLALIPLSSGSLDSIGRFDIVFFPIVLVLARLGGRSAGFDRAYSTVAVGLGAVFTALFAQWYWVS